MVTLLSTCEGTPIYKHLLLGCGNASVFQPVLLNLPFAPLTTEQHHIPIFVATGRKHQTRVHEYYSQQQKKLLYTGWKDRTSALVTHT